jgi:hypothetical protein
VFFWVLGERGEHHGCPTSIVCPRQHRGVHKGYRGRCKCSTELFPSYCPIGSEFPRKKVAIWRGRGSPPQARLDVIGGNDPLSCTDCWRQLHLFTETKWWAIGENDLQSTGSYPFCIGCKLCSLGGSLGIVSVLICTCRNAPETEISRWE